jgi:hypothetical protein
MLISKLKIFTIALAAAAVGLLAVTQVGAANNGVGAVKLEGAWVAKVQGAPAQWSYVLSPDASGRRAAFHGSIDVGLGGGIPHDRESPLLGEMVMTGPDTAKVVGVWYGISNTLGVVYIGVSVSDAEYVAQGKAVATHTLSIGSSGNRVGDSGAF